MTRRPFNHLPLADHLRETRERLDHLRDTQPSADAPKLYLLTWGRNARPLLAETSQALDEAAEAIEQLTGD